MNSSEYKYPPQRLIAFLRGFVHLVSKILWRIEFHQTENIPQDLEGGLLVAPNHQTYFDPFWVCVKIRRKLSFMAWDEIFNWFFIGKIIRYLGAFPVSLSRTGKIKASRQAMKLLDKGTTLIIFPEGEREFSDAKLLDFKPGAVRIAMEAGVPILPVTIRGANKIWAQDLKFPRFRKVEIFYHPIINIPKPDKNVSLHDHINKLNKELAEIISTKMS